MGHPRPRPRTNHNQPINPQTAWAWKPLGPSLRLPDCTPIGSFVLSYTLFLNYRCSPRKGVPGRDGGRGWEWFGHRRCGEAGKRGSSFYPTGGDGWPQHPGYDPTSSPVYLEDHSAFLESDGITTFTVLWERLTPSGSRVGRPGGRQIAITAFVFMISRLIHASVFSEARRVLHQSTFSYTSPLKRNTGPVVSAF